MSESTKSKIKKEEPSGEISKNYFEGIGRRKRAVARVRVFTSGPADSIEAGSFTVNKRSYKEYFPTLILQRIVEDPFIKLKSLNRFTGTVNVTGGGINAQAEAIRMGTSRALTMFDMNFRKKLKKSGYLRRDPREVERKKFGLKKARRAPQWSKR